MAAFSEVAELEVRKFTKAVKNAKVGWGGRDRTYECRNQNPVPYHLATPQKTV
jgi:hypothetical protein